MQMMHYLMKYALICIYFQNTLDIFLYHSINQETVGSQEEGFFFYHVFRNKMLKWIMIINTSIQNLQNIDMNKLESYLRLKWKS